MPLLSLLLGLALPWLAGALALRVLETGRREPGAMLRQLGFGLFLGMTAMALGLRLVDALTGHLSWWLVVLALGLVALLGLGLLALRPRTPASMPATPAPAPAVRVIGLCLLGGIVAHFLFSGIEILTQPVFPWDGWTVWVYRAKAWFGVDHLVPMVTKARWLATTDPTLYTTPALRYPLLPSLVPLWVALGLGQWHETLVNLPVLACAVAIALGLAGCLRRAGANGLWVLASVYLLFSTPLFGTHMSLGGYADIWMAGFAGLGMTGLLCGLLTERRPLVLGGLLFLALATGVKVEGLVWFVTGIAILLLVRLKPRLLLTGLGVLVLLVAIAGFSGHTVIDLPVLGKVGLRGQWLYVPFKGHVTLQMHDLWGAYLTNAFLLGSWHALWAFVGVALVVQATRPREPLSRIAGAFFLCFALVQALIFVFTTEGAWAEDFTAINRMPLQMLPALLFLLVTILSRRLGPGLETLRRPGMRRALAFGLAGSVVITVAGIVAWQAAVQPAGASSRLDIEPPDLAFVVGGGTTTNDALRVESYGDGIALLSSGRVNLEAANYPFLDVDFQFDDAIDSLDEAPAFFWRRADQPREVSRVTLLRPGLVNLAASDDWRGEIVEYGFFFVDHDGAPATLRSARLEGASLANTLRMVPGQWTAFETWTQRSAHWNPGGAWPQRVPFTGVVLVMSLLAALFAWLLAGRRQGVACLVFMLFAGWVSLDARWGWDRVRQAQLSLAQLRDLSVDQRLADGELGVFFDYLERLRAQRLGDEPRRIILIRDPALHKYFGLRAKYQLLPHSVAVLRRLPDPRRLARVDYVLYLGAFSSGDPAANPGESPARRWQRLELADRPAERRLLEVVDEDPQGTLFRVIHEGADAAR